MANWENDKRWSDKFLPEIKMILGLHLIGEPPIEEDCERNTDLIVLKMEPVRIACRIRKYKYFIYDILYFLCSVLLSLLLFRQIDIQSMLFLIHRLVCICLLILLNLFLPVLHLFLPVLHLLSLLFLSHLH